jgi:outer membrane receptor for ferric coprogen and ferric-rhodotorulic acid
LFDRQHELTLGANYGRSHLKAGADTIAANGLHALVDLASYDIDSHWSTALNLNNVTDRKYLLSLYESTTTANYGAPRNLTASVTWKY